MTASNLLLGAVMMLASMSMSYVSYDPYLVSKRRYWLVLGGTWSIWAVLVVLSQYGAVLVCAWWYLVTMGWY